MKTTAALLAVLAGAAPAVTHATEEAGAPAVNVMTPPPQGPSWPPPSVPPGFEPEPPKKGRWYGWELMLSDTLFLLVASDQGHETGLGSYGLPIGLVGLAAVPPALHFIHDNRSRVPMSLLIRGGAVGLLALARQTLDGDNNAPCTGDHCSNIDIGPEDLMLPALAVVAVGGAITYVVIEYVRYSRVPVGEPPRPRATIAPTAMLRPGGGGIAFVGSF